MNEDSRIALRDEYFRYTRTVLPQVAAERRWPATEEAHFQRIVLDNVCGCVWYHKLKDPAVMHLSKSQLRKAVRMCEEMIVRENGFEDLNERSLAWQEAANLPPDHDAYRRAKERMREETSPTT